MRKLELQAAIFVYCSHGCLEVLGRGAGFLHVLEDYEANWSGSLELFLAGLVPQERMGIITGYWKGGSGMLQ